MKKYLAIMTLLMATGCIGETDYGECIGFGATQDPAKTYKISLLNAVLAAFFVETRIVPVVWAVEYVYCPTDNVTSPTLN